MQESQGVGQATPPWGTLCSCVSILSGKQWEDKAVCSVGPIIPQPVIASGSLGFLTPSTQQGTHIHPSGTFHACCLQPEGPFSSRAAAFCHSTVGKEPGEEVFVQAGVTAIACYQLRSAQWR